MRLDDNLRRLLCQHIGGQLEAARTARRETLTETAAAVRVSYLTLYKLEAGTRCPSPAMLTVLRRELGISFDAAVDHALARLAEGGSAPPRRSRNGKPASGREGSRP